VVKLLHKLKLKRLIKWYSENSTPRYEERNADGRFPVRREEDEAELIEIYDTLDT